MTDPTDLTIAEAAALLGRGEMSPVELTEAYLARIDEIDPAVRAYTAICGERALDEARCAADELARGLSRGPLHGIPLAVKDLIDTAGIVTAGGSKAYADRIPTADATVMRMLSAAGAVLLGKLNTDELAFGVTTSNELFGATRNPWDPERTPGGSSGGSGAATAARLAAATLGTDTAGSIRIPASFCGCVGLKPTFGRVSAAGVLPLSRSADHVGPLTRTVEDAAIVLEAIAGYDAGDALTVPMPVPDYRAALTGDIAGVRVGVSTTSSWGLLDDGVRAVVETAVDVLVRLGAVVANVELPDVATVLGPPGLPGLMSLAVEESRFAHKEAWQDRPEDFGSDLRELYAASAVDAACLAESLAAMRRYTEAVRGALLEADVLVSPTTPFVAPLAGAEQVELGGRSWPLRGAAVRNTVPFNVAGLPAISVPCGVDPDTGMPVGLQIAGRPFAEATVLRVAHAYERAAGWFLPTPGVSLGVRA